MARLLVVDSASTACVTTAIQQCCQSSADVISLQNDRAPWATSTRLDPMRPSSSGRQTLVHSPSHAVMGCTTDAEQKSIDKCLFLFSAVAGVVAPPRRWSSAAGLLFGGGCPMPRYQDPELWHNLFIFDLITLDSCRCSRWKCSHSSQSVKVSRHLR